MVPECNEQRIRLRRNNGQYLLVMCMFLRLNKRLRPDQYLFNIENLVLPRIAGSSMGPGSLLNLDRQFDTVR
jgi:hypothetical protein